MAQICTICLYKTLNCYKRWTSEANYVYNQHAHWLSRYLLTHKNRSGSCFSWYYQENCGYLSYTMKSLLLYESNEPKRDLNCPTFLERRPLTDLNAHLLFIPYRSYAEKYCKYHSVVKIMVIDVLYATIGYVKIAGRTLYEMKLVYNGENITKKIRSTISVSFYGSQI